VPPHPPLDERGFRGFVNFLPELASNHDPPNLCFLSRWNYRLEPTMQGNYKFNGWSEMGKERNQTCPFLQFSKN
jgi:hypothetical protein